MNATAATLACRSCGRAPLREVLDLGAQPLANSFPKADDHDDDPRYPLVLAHCDTCRLLQLTTTVDPEVLFSDYLYFSSYSSTFTAIMRDLASAVIEREGLDRSSFVVEIASNDGYLLREYASRGVPVLGVEPAENVASVAVAAGIDTVAEFFGLEVAERLASERQADVIHAHNVLAHVPDVNDVVAGVARLLSPEGVFIVETPYAAAFLEKAEWDTVYHEHVFVYSVTAIIELMRRHGMRVDDAELLPHHGGSLRLFIRHGDAPPPENVVAFVERESDTWETLLADLAGRVERTRRETLDFVASIRAGNGRLAAYGAAAKGTVFLNHVGLDADDIAYVVDKNPHKQDRRVPGTAIPVVAPEALAADPPTHLLVLIWNLLNEVMAEQASFAAAGGRFVVAMPELREL